MLYLLAKVILKFNYKDKSPKIEKAEPTKTAEPIKEETKQPEVEKKVESYNPNTEIKIDIPNFSNTEFKEDVQEINDTCKYFK